MIIQGISYPAKVNLSPNEPCTGGVHKLIILGMIYNLMVAKIMMIYSKYQFDMVFQMVNKPQIVGSVSSCGSHMKSLSGENSPTFRLPQNLIWLAQSPHTIYIYIYVYIYIYMYIYIYIFGMIYYPWTGNPKKNPSDSGFWISNRGWLICPAEISKQIHMFHMYPAWISCSKPARVFPGTRPTQALEGLGTLSLQASWGDLAIWGRKNRRWSRKICGLLWRCYWRMLNYLLCFQIHLFWSKFCWLMFFTRSMTLWVLQESCDVVEIWAISS